MNNKEKIESHVANVSHRNVLIEKHHTGKLMWAIIRKCTKKHLWYKQFVGECFFVRNVEGEDDYRRYFMYDIFSKRRMNHEIKNKFLAVDTHGVFGEIEKQDCDVLK